MQCKNCENTLRTDYSYCPDCGAKVIRNRITFRNLWFDFTKRFFNLDNTFLRTFGDLFRRPGVVIGGYISGVRKKYMNPISYFTIALTLGGIVLFLMKKDLIEISQMGQFSSGMVDAGNTRMNNPAMKQAEKFTQWLFEYQNLFYVLTIPILVLISRVVFWNKKEYNLSEHFVINIYGYSHVSICINTLYLMTFWNQTLLQTIAVFSTLLYIVYYSYAFKQLFNLSWPSLILKFLLFLGIAGVIFTAVVIGFTVYLLSQPEFLEQIKAAKQNAN